MVPWWTQMRTYYGPTALDSGRIRREQFVPTSLPLSFSDCDNHQLTWVKRAHAEHDLPDSNGQIPNYIIQKNTNENG